MFFTDDDAPPLYAVKQKFDITKAAKINYDLEPLIEFSDIEIVSMPSQTLIFDVECYWNYFLIMFRCPQTRKVILFEDTPESTFNREKLKYVIDKFEIVGFFSAHYDVPMVYSSLMFADSSKLKEITNYIIEKKYDDYGREIKIRPEDVYERYNIPVFMLPRLNHIDIKEVCPLDGSLKIYGARLHSRRLQSLPYHPDMHLSRDEATITRHYCGNDCDVTILLWDNLEEQIKLRRDLSQQYEIDLRSKSDAQIAEAVLCAEIKKRTGRRPQKPTLPTGYTCRYSVPDFIRFETPEMQDVLRRITDAKFGLDGNGSPQMPDELKTDKGDGKDDKDAGYKFFFRGTYYKIGMGGLHSCEKSIGYTTEGGKYIIADNDVESYYPRIKINQRLFPKHIGPAYIDVYEEIVNRRVNAKGQAKACKLAGDKVGAKLWKAIADSLKIVINGAFGKLGSKYSALYSPDLMLQVTLTGQLLLLMLVERLELAGIHVISANTDGIVSRYLTDMHLTMRGIIDQWCKDTNFKTEETQYHALYSRDINNYIAVKKGGDEKNGWTDEIEGCKGKGAYANPWNDPDLAIFRFHKNPESAICIEAVTELLTRGTSIRQTVEACKDITKFVSVMAASGGAHKDGVYLGSPVRWYYGKRCYGPIRKVNGDKVNKSEGAKPCMDLPVDFPDDIDYDRYINEAERILNLIGYYEKPKPLELFE